MTRLSLHRVEAGSGTPLVILHGLFGAAHNWGSIVRRLAAERRVIAADLRNHGASPHDPQMDYPSMAEDVAGLIDAHAGGRAAVLGHSMGGKVAMTLALTRPVLVERLIVVDIAPVPYRVALGAHAAALKALPLAPGMRRAEADAALRAVVESDAKRAFLLQNLRFEGDGPPRWRINLDAIAANMPVIAGFPEFPPQARYEGPTLLVSGETSGYVGPEHRDAMLALFPRTVFVVVPGAGHWVQTEAPEPFLRAVVPFLAMPG